MASATEQWNELNAADESEIAKVADGSIHCARGILAILDGEDDE